MKKIIEGVMLVIFAMVMVLFVFTKLASAERFEDQNLSVTSKLPPQYLGWTIEASSANPQNQTVATYYKVSAVVTGVGETAASPVTTGYSATGPLVSSNSLRVMWAPVNGAATYKLYKSVDNSAFYLMNNANVLTYVDEGATVGAAYAAPTQRGGSLTVEKDVTLGGQLMIGNYTSAEIKLLVPKQAKGSVVLNSTTGMFCISSAAILGSWVSPSTGTVVALQACF